MPKQVIPPGQRLDDLVAEKVMGWRKLELRRNLWGLTWMWEQRPESRHWECQSTLPFSTDLATSFTVVEKLKEIHGSDRGLGLRYSLTENVWIFGPYSAGDQGEDEFYTNAQAKATTPQHAICLAALKAVGAIIEEEVADESNG